LTVKDVKSDDQLFPKFSEGSNAHDVYVAANHRVLQLATISMPINVHTRPLYKKKFR